MVTMIAGKETTKFCITAGHGLERWHIELLSYSCWLLTELALGQHQVIFQLNWAEHLSAQTATKGISCLATDLDLYAQSSSSMY